MAFYLHRDGQTVPFELETLRTMARQGELRQDEYIYVEAKGEWIGAALVPEMSNAWNIEESEATVAMEIPPEFFAGLDAGAAPAPEPAPAPVAIPRAPEPAPAPRPQPAPRAPEPAPAPRASLGGPANDFGGAAPSSGKSSAQGGGRAKVRSYEEIAAQPTQFDAIELIKEAWGISKPNLGMLILSFLVVGLVSGIASVIPLGGLIVGVPVAVGLTVVSLRLIEGQDVAIGNVFDGFKRFVPLMICGLIIGIGTVIGTLLLILPGMYFAMASGYAPQLVLDRGEEPMDAIKGSMKVFNANFVSLLVFASLLGLLNFVGVLACGIGILITAPVSIVATNLMYKRLFGVAGGYANPG